MGVTLTKWIAAKMCAGLILHIHTRINCRLRIRIHFAHNYYNAAHVLHACMKNACVHNANVLHIIFQGACVKADAKFNFSVQSSGQLLGILCLGKNSSKSGLNMKFGLKITG